MIAVLVLLQLIWVQPDAQRTPGKVNPDVTQGNIAENICSNTWSTRQVRPPGDYTRKLKLDQMQQYGDTVPDEAGRCFPGSNNPKCYEEDHLISLQAGGHPTDPENLWPQPYNSEINGQIVGARQKDLVESFIHDEICFAIPDSRKNSKIYHPHSGLTSKRGQEILAKDWFTCYLSMVRGEDCK